VPQSVGLRGPHNTETGDPDVRLVPCQTSLPSRSILTTLGATVLLAAAACRLAFRTWSDGDRAELELALEDAEWESEEE